MTPLNINITQEQYNDFKSKKINKTRGWLYRYFYAKYKGKKQISKTITFDNFDEKQREQFYAICGPTMVKLGYK